MSFDSHRQETRKEILIK